MAGVSRFEKARDGGCPLLSPGIKSDVFDVRRVRAKLGAARISSSTGVNFVMVTMHRPPSTDSLVVTTLHFSQLCEAFTRGKCAQVVRF